MLKKTRLKLKLIKLEMGLSKKKYVGIIIIDLIAKMFNISFSYNGIYFGKDSQSNKYYEDCEDRIQIIKMEKIIKNKVKEEGYNPNVSVLMSNDDVIKKLKKDRILLS